MKYPTWLKPHLYEFYDLGELLLLATCIYGEAASESYDGKFAVGCVVRNRVEVPGWWGDSYHRVILSPKQFSCFNLDAPTLSMMKNPKGRAWQDSLKAAREVLDGKPDITGNATHYFADYIKKPEWAKRMVKTCKIGVHEFYFELGSA